MKRINIKSSEKYYIETWAIYFDICDKYSAIKGEDIYKKFKLVISFDSLYVPEESLKNDIVEYSKKKDIPTAQAIREAIKNYLKENK